MELSANKDPSFPALADGGPKEISQPASKIVPLMDLVLSPVRQAVKPSDKKAEEEEEEELSGKKKFCRSKKELQNVFTRMQGNEEIKETYTFAAEYLATPD